MRAVYYLIYLSVVLITVALLTSSYADVPANQQLAVIGAGDINCPNCDLSGADLTSAVFSITSIKGTNLATPTGLTQAQVDMACGDASTRLPPGLTVKTCL